MASLFCHKSLSAIYVLSFTTINRHQNILARRLTISVLLLLWAFQIHAQTPTSSWQRGMDFPINGYQYDPVEYNSCLYVIGGYNGVALKSAYYTHINSDGSLQPWQATTSLPVGDQGPSVAACNGHIYVLTGTGMLYGASIQTDGSLGGWSSLPIASGMTGSRMAMRAYKNRLYLLGGYYLHDGAWSTVVNEDGTLGTWAQVGHMPQTRQHQSVHFYNGRVYIAGGISDGSGILDTVYSAAANDNGTLDAWRAEAKLPYPLWYHSSVLVDDEIWLLGGRSDYGNSGFRYTILRGKIDSTAGTIAQWMPTISMPSNSIDGPGAVYVPAVQSIYIIGGNDPVSHHFTAEVWRLFTPTLVVLPESGENFGAIKVGSSQDETFQISNLGSGLIVGSVSVAAPFSVVSGGSYQLRAGETQFVTLRFAPTSSGISQRTVTFSGGKGIQRQVSGMGFVEIATGAANGRVLDDNGFNPIQGAKVTIEGLSTVTDWKGTYRIDGLLPGIHTISAIADQYVGKALSGISVIAGQDTPVPDLALTLRSSSNVDPKDIPVVLVRGFNLDPVKTDTQWTTGSQEYDYWQVLRDRLRNKEHFKEVWDCNEPTSGVFYGQGHVIDGRERISYNGQRLREYLTQKIAAYQNDPAHLGRKPQAINIVAHSMGGLITRYMISNATQTSNEVTISDVPIKNVIMLSTPNAGSYLADFATVAKEFIAIPGFSASILNWFDSAFPSTKDLTTLNMRYLFPLIITWPKSASMDLYLMGGTGFDKRKSIFNLTGAYISSVSSMLEDENDGAVTYLSSHGTYFVPSTIIPVNSFPYANPLEISKWPLNHSEMTTHPTILNHIIDILNQNASFQTMGAGMQSLASSLTVTDKELYNMQQFTLTTGSLLLGSSTNMTLPSDARTTLSVSCMWSGRGLHFFLKDPANRVIDSQSAMADTKIVYSQYEDMSTSSGFATYAISMPPTGNWTVVLDTQGTSSTDVNYVITAQGDSPLTLTPVTHDHILGGAWQRVSCTIFDKKNDQITTVTGATVTARVVAPDGSIRTRLLYDDGAHGDGAANNGTYSDDLSTMTLAGEYHVHYFAQGTGPDGIPFCRMASNAFHVSSNGGFICGDIAESGVDIDCDGMVDLIQLRFPVSLQNAGDYSISGELTDPSNTAITVQAAKIFSALPDSVTMVTLEFVLRNLVRSMGIGPFTISRLQLYQIKNNDYLWMNDYNRYYTTNKYSSIKPIFVDIIASPTLARVGTSVKISFTSSQAMLTSPTVNVNGNAAIWMRHNIFKYTYLYTVQDSDSDGSATLVISGTNMSGSSGLTTNTSVLVIDKTPPAAPSRPALDSADDSGFSNTDGITTQTTGLTLRGTAETGSIIKVWEGSTLLTSGTAAAFAGSGLDIGLSEKTHPVTATATDAAGNESSPSQALTIQVDTTAPTAGTVAPPAYANASPIHLTYSGAGDSGSGLNHVDLWVKKGTAGVWDDTDIVHTGASGLLDFVPAVEGTYYFALVAVDNAGNRSAVPTGNGDGITVFDTTAPLKPLVSGNTPTSTTTPTWTWVSGGGGGSAAFRYQLDGQAGGWTTTTLLSWTPAAPLSQGSHALYVQERDAAGNWSASGSFLILSDATAPLSGTATPPALAKSAPIVVPYGGAGDAGSGLRQVALWFKKDSGAWTASGLVQSTASGSFSFDGAHGLNGDGRYAFALQATDRAGNRSSAPTDLGDGVTLYDITAPIVRSVTRLDTSPTSSTTVRFRVGFSEAVSGVTTSSFALTRGGVLSGAVVTSASMDSPTTCTMRVATGSGDGTLRLDVKTSGTGIQDLAGNDLDGGFSSGESYTIDKTAPTIQLASSAANPINGPFIVSATLGELARDFTSSSVSVSNGVVSGFNGSGKNYAWTVIPGPAQTTVTCFVPAGAFHDAAGNGNTASNAISRLYDNIQPHVSNIVRLSPTQQLTNATQVVWRVTFDEALQTATVNPEDFHFSLIAGSILNFSALKVSAVTAAIYDVTANTGAGDGELRLDVPATATILDLAGNAFIASHVGGESYRIDKSSPRMVLACSAANPTSTPLYVTATLSETAADFTTASVEVTNGMVSGFSGSGTSYSWKIIPGQGAVSCLVPGGKFHDAAGNANTASNTFSRTCDSLPPQSQVTAPTGTTTNPALTINWKATDPGISASGLRLVRIYWSKDLGAASLMGTYTPSTNSASFNASAHGGPGVYYFYSVATDKAGNIEAPPAQPDVSVTVGQPSASFVGNAVVPRTAGTARLSVTLNQPSAVTVSVSYATGADGDSAQAGTDYVAKTGTLTFSPGVTSQTLTVALKNNPSATQIKFFTLKLTGATNGVLGAPALARVSITPRVLSNVVLSLLDLTSTSLALDYNGDRVVDITDELYRIELLKTVAPTDPTPADRATNVAASPILRWSTCSFTKSYDLYLWKASSAKPSSPTASGLTTNTYAPPTALQVGTAYKWQVIAIKNSGNQTGPIWSFTTKY